MANTMTINVRVGGTLCDHVAANVGDDGHYENVSEYIRDLIRRDRVRKEEELFHDLKAELVRAFSSPENAFKDYSAADIIARAKRRMA